MGDVGNLIGPSAADLPGTAIFRRMFPIRVHRAGPAGPPRTRQRGGSVVWAAAVLAALVLGLTACDRSTEQAEQDDSRTSTLPTPESEFVVTAGDSTFWVRSGAHGVSVRASPILLARLDGRFYELYVTDDDRSYRDAVFVGQQLWRRDIVSNDSARVWADSAVSAHADAWGVENPGDRPLAPGEPESEEPIASAITELSVLDVVGPYLSVEWFADVHPAGGLPSHQLHRRVLDLRTGEPVSLAALLGDRAAAELTAAGARAFSRLSDSLATVEDDISAGSFVFDANSFALGVEGGRPAIAFLAPARGEAAGDVGGLPLDPLVVAPPGWWAAARAERPEPDRTGTEDRWQRRGGVQLMARYDSTDGNAELVLLTLPDRESPTPGDAVEAVRTTPRSWPLVRLTPPLLRVYWLDQPELTAPERRALRRAFDEADRYESDLPYPKLPGRIAALGSAGRSASPVLALAPR